MIFGSGSFAAFAAVFIVATCSNCIVASSDTAADLPNIILVLADGKLINILHKPTTSEQTQNFPFLPLPLFSTVPCLAFPALLSSFTLVSPFFVLFLSLIFSLCFIVFFCILGRLLTYSTNIYIYIYIYMYILYIYIYIYLVCPPLPFNPPFSAPKQKFTDQGWSDVGYNAAPSRQYEPGAGGAPGEGMGKWKPNPPRTPHLDAMANGSHSLLFHRFYAGSGVCSPTRSALLTGRTPDRECITGAEGCGQAPAYSCNDPLPFPPPTFTLAEAAKKAGYATLHAGKWHLGNFFRKPKASRSFAEEKWPVSHPGMHGFDEWHSTEASASSTTCNCGCEAAWPMQGDGCITGGGSWTRTPFACTNYWTGTDSVEGGGTFASAYRPECHIANESTRDCVANLTSKIPGDDSRYLMDVFEDFHDRKVKAGEKYLAVLWLHTNHEPHPALPEYFYAYNDTYGKPAGDYLGTLTQMDVQIGRLRAMVANEPNTMVWYAADNGPHPGSNLPDVRSATNGLRQCKASLYEGGIRVPGIVEWPARITRHRETWVPAYVSDYLPTLLEVFGQSHPNPSWAADGESLLPLVDATDFALDGVTVGQGYARNTSLVFQLGSQQAIIAPNGTYKIVQKPVAGQCKMEPRLYKDKGQALLFNLDTDPTETHPLNDEYPELYKQMSAQLAALKASIELSAVQESKCKAPPGPAPGPPGPSPPPGPAMQLMYGGKCLAADAETHANLTLQSCGSDGVVGNNNSDSDEVGRKTKAITKWRIKSNIGLVLDDTRLCAHLAKSDSCSPGVGYWMGPVCKPGNGLFYNNGTLRTCDMNGSLC